MRAFWVEHIYFKNSKQVNIGRLGVDLTILGI